MIYAAGTFGLRSGELKALMSPKQEIYK